jgi:hypothetical protein
MKNTNYEVLHYLLPPIISSFLGPNILLRTILKHSQPTHFPSTEGPLRKMKSKIGFIDLILTFLENR